MENQELTQIGDDSQPKEQEPRVQAAIDAIGVITAKARRARRFRDGWMVAVQDALGNTRFTTVGERRRELAAIGITRQTSVEELRHKLATGIL